MALYWLAIYLLNATLMIVSAVSGSWLCLGVSCVAMFVAFHCLWNVWR